jgi:hypothetical protein
MPNGICNPVRNDLCHVVHRGFAQNLSGGVANPAALHGGMKFRRLGNGFIVAQRFDGRTGIVYPAKCLKRIGCADEGGASFAIDALRFSAHPMALRQGRRAQ